MKSNACRSSLDITYEGSLTIFKERSLSLFCSDATKSAPVRKGIIVQRNALNLCTKIILAFIANNSLLHDHCVIAAERLRKYVLPSSKWSGALTKYATIFHQRYSMLLGAALLRPHPEEAAKQPFRRIEGGPWFETRGFAALLTMRPEEAALLVPYSTFPVQCGSSRSRTG